jgi:hypothetical protein
MIREHISFGGSVKRAAINIYGQFFGGGATGIFPNDPEGQQNNIPLGVTQTPGTWVFREHKRSLNGHQGFSANAVGFGHRIQLPLHGSRLSAQLLQLSDAILHDNASENQASEVAPLDWTGSVSS